VAGGTIRFLRTDLGFGHLDPQLDVVPEDAMFASGYLQRTLTAYEPSPTGSRLVPDLATDTGRPGADASTWSFTLRTGSEFEDGSPITCADVKYGVSRAFATNQLPGARAAGMRLLDIPLDATGSPTYHGPYETGGNDVAAFDRAVRCSPDNRTVTFRLSRPAGDFNGAVSQLAFSPVPRAADTGAGYDQHPLASGPYRIAARTPDSLTLVRNEKWSRSSDPYRPAYPDRVEVKFGLSAAAIAARLASPSPADRAAVMADPDTGANPAAAPAGSPSGQATWIAGDDPWVRYLAIDTTKVTVLDHRRAILAALDRAGINDALAAESPGALADGLISPGLGTAYRPTHLWDTLLGAAVGDHGDPAFARSLVTRSGTPLPPLTFAYDQSPTNDAVARTVVDSLRRAGITVIPRPIPRSQYYRLMNDPATGSELMLSTWGADWPSGGTVIPALLTRGGAHNLSRYDDPSFTAAATAAAGEPDPAAEAGDWARLNVAAVTAAVAAPLRFDQERRLVGPDVRGAYLWSAYGTLPYPQLWVVR
jgi:peptide/nickel transport system substrate-binding protein